MHPSGYQRKSQTVRPVAQVAYETGTPIIRVRESFLREKHLPGLISPDGIHLTMEGYTKMFDTLAGWLRQAIA